MTIAAEATPRLSVAAYRDLVRRGAIVDGTPLELIGGVLVLKDRRDGGEDAMTVGRRHAAAIRRLERLLGEAAGGAAVVVQSQLPVVLDDESAPEPDVAVLRGRVEDFDAREPTAADVLLLIEVADSSLAYDRGEKRRRYRDAGVSDYWIVNLQNDTLEVTGDGPTPAAVFDPVEAATIAPPPPLATISVPAIFPSV